jgi:hypothetical protein
LLGGTSVTLTNKSIKKLIPSIFAAFQPNPALLKKTNAGLVKPEEVKKAIEYSPSLIKLH